MQSPVNNLLARAALIASPIEPIIVLQLPVLTRATIASRAKALP
jgi:hypothetical protein